MKSHVKYIFILPSLQQVKPFNRYLEKSTAAFLALKPNCNFLGHVHFIMMLSSVSDLVSLVLNRTKQDADILRTSCGGEGN